MSIKHNKLVRDNIINIIKNSNKKCEYRVLNDEEYLSELYLKLNEEFNEFKEGYSIEELADMQEVMDAIIKARGYTKESFKEVQESKSKRNGKFDKKLYLMEVSGNE